LLTKYYKLRAQKYVIINLNLFFKIFCESIIDTFISHNIIDEREILIVEKATVNIID
jgi:hypothetical protein